MEKKHDSRAASFPKSPTLILLWLSLGLFSIAHPGWAEGPEPAGSERPRLVVLIMVDQLRGDLPLRYAADFGEGGFRYLLESGVCYTAAQQPHSHTETVVGHTTVSTGAYPAAHGMIGNSWFERAPAPTDSDVSNTDREAPGQAVQTLAMKVSSTDHGLMHLPSSRAARTEGQSDQSTEGDSGGHVQSSAGGGDYTLVGSKRPGASPDQILTTTLGDELTVTTAEGAKVFAVSIKARAAVALAGHSGKAFWFDGNTGRFVTSTYYYEMYPEWVNAWNAAKHADSYSGKSWTLSLPRSEYLYGDQDDRPWEPDLYNYGRVFPHPFGKVGNPMQSAIFYAKLTTSPVADSLILSFARTLIENEGLGEDDVPDVLGISLSANDIIGHAFGPSSLESEVSIRTLDRHLAGLFAYLDRRIGLENTVVVLAGDHGIPEIPAYLETLKIPTGQISADEILALGVQALSEQYDDGDKMVLSYQHPYFYLDRELIHSAGLSQVEIERFLAHSVSKSEAILFAVPSSELRRGGEEMYPEIIDRIRRNQNPDRSGDVYVVQASQWQVGQPPAPGEPVVIVNHGSPWAYDTYVPVAFAGFGIEPAVVSRQISTVDIAPTLALFLRAKPPSAAIGSPLVEVVSNEP